MKIEKKIAISIGLFLTFLLVSSRTTVAADKLLYSTDLVYQGAFRVSPEKFGGSSLHYGGTAIAYNSNRDSLFIVGHDWYQQVAEIQIPQLINSSNLNDLKTAKILQPFTDITEGHMHNIEAWGAAYSDGVKIGGLMVYGNKLIGSVYAYYDASGKKSVLSHFTSGLTLSTSDFSGMYQVGSKPEVPNPGFVDGYMAAIPSAWRPLLGGPALTGNSTIPITFRTSCGPAAFVFNPDDLGKIDPVPVAAVVYYSLAHPTLGKWGSTNPNYNGSTVIKGVVFPAGSRSVLFFGRHGTGPFCYGSGTSDPALAGKPASPNGKNKYCYDPSSSDKGTHGYPYVYQVWAYDANDLVAVKDGKKNPWDIMPYSVWNFDLPFQPKGRRIGGVAYDPTTQRIFVSQLHSDGDLPVIHVFKVSPSATGRP